MQKKTGARTGIKAKNSRRDTPVKLEEVALAAGVSPSTVSRILNGTAVVSELKKKAVDDAIAKLGFVPNPVARGLAGGRTLSIGVIASDRQPVLRRFAARHRRWARPGGLLPFVRERALECCR